MKWGVSMCKHPYTPTLGRLWSVYHLRLGIKYYLGIQIQIGLITNKRSFSYISVQVTEKLSLKSNNLNRKFFLNAIFFYNSVHYFSKLVNLCKIEVKCYLKVKLTYLILNINCFSSFSSCLPYHYNISEMIVILFKNVPY